jgi:hypothetical protein
LGLSFIQNLDRWSFGALLAQQDMRIDIICMMALGITD